MPRQLSSEQGRRLVTRLQDYVENNARGRRAIQEELTGMSDRITAVDDIVRSLLSQRAFQESPVQFGELRRTREKIDRIIEDVCSRGAFTEFIVALEETLKDHIFDDLLKWCKKNTQLGDTVTDGGGGSSGAQREPAAVRQPPVPSSTVTCSNVVAGIIGPVNAHTVHNYTIPPTTQPAP